MPRSIRWSIGQPRSVRDVPPWLCRSLPKCFATGDWDSDGAPQIAWFIGVARKTWDNTPKAPPREIVQPIRLANGFGASISTKDFQDDRLRVALEQNLLDALLWGLANPDRFETWYAEAMQRHQSSLTLMQSSGLDVDALPVLEEFLQQSEEIVRNYERDIGPLPSIPDRLLSDARAVGVKINE